MPPSTPTSRTSKPPTPTPTPKSHAQPSIAKPTPQRVVFPEAHLRHTPLASRIPGSTGPRVGGGGGSRRPPLPANDIRQTKEYKAAARK
ncbi:uncharacterized protein BO66DRAFT_388213 [Aspergillus aculeatinus CBS 121060]|uniref:Uncharacterized protein n=1 Tax=Aspergillus aculeatinus CBS 121060 TaxID=1448322 RepID=A0ACD1HL27_9EURO|nr:hypothetical protein BO66DRAFT_388213 [Aspergillus aculeatinus CBS 121060]RAH74146.1 hypothetical protein BO66DRAFT_388213 [Aspergillus aculeatinus CBS 121060]